MIDNFNKCCQCGEHKKEEDISIYNSNKTKFFQCKNCSQKNLITEPKIKTDILLINKTNIDKTNITLKNDEKKLDLKEPIKKIIETNYLNKKRPRISKNIVFRRKKMKKNLDEFTNIIYKIIEQSNNKNKLLINIKDSNKNQNTVCDLCQNQKLNKENKIITISSFNEFKDFFETIYNNLEQEENNKKLIQISKLKYNQIIQNKKNINQIIINLNKDISSLIIYKNFCCECIYKYLLKINGINILWGNIQNDEKKSSNTFKNNFEIISGLKDIRTNSKNNIKNNNENEDKNNKNDNNDGNDNDNDNENNILDNEINNMFRGKANIFDLILGDEDDDNDINDLDNNSEENKSIKNKNNDIKKINDNKKDKKIKKGKTKENKITFKKIIPFNNQLNKNKLNNNFININNEENDKNKNLLNINNLKNINNINNINNITQFKDSKYNNKSQEINQPLFFNIYNANNNFLKPNMSINNNNNNYNNAPYLNNNNNINSKSNENLVYNRLINQLSFLKNKLCLIANLNNTRKANNNNINSNSPILISTNSFIENLVNFKNSMDMVFDYMDNISDTLDKISCINENSVSLINSVINGNINQDNLIQLSSNSNYFSQILNSNYNLQKMNSKLCDLINK